MDSAVNISPSRTIEAKCYREVADSILSILNSDNEEATIVKALSVLENIATALIQPSTMDNMSFCHNTFNVTEARAKEGQAGVQDPDLNYRDESSIDE